MAKNKMDRSMGSVGASQQVVEKAVSDKFDSLPDFLQPSKQTKAMTEVSAGRINPQLSCTIEPEDKQLLNDLALYASNRERKILNTSVIIRALIRLGNKHKDELVF